jgi:hypothetical protein
MLAVQRLTKHAATNARNATFVITGRCSGASEEKPPIMMPIEDGFAKLQMA